MITAIDTSERFDRQIRVSLMLLGQFRFLMSADYDISFRML